MRKELVIIGASARAAAQSACRADFTPYAIDLFGDTDLRRTCTSRVVSNYPSEFVAAIKSDLPQCPWMYTGSLENFPDLIDIIARDRPLLGNQGSIVRKLRDPWQLADACRTHGISYPAILPADSLPVGGEWLRKPYLSGGGHAITRMSINDPNTTPIASTTHYLQKYVPGQSLSAVYVAVNGHAELIGMTRQLIGEAGKAGFKEFAYLGSIGPLQISVPRTRDLQVIGNSIAHEFHLVGLFGIDFVDDGENFWLIEVNPRYTASIEVLERSLDIRAISTHVQGCLGTEPLPVVPTTVNGIHAKLIVYASRKVVIQRDFLRWSDEQNGDQTWPVIADIPRFEAIMERTQPICTVFARGRDINSAQRLLNERVVEVERRLGM